MDSPRGGIFRVAMENVLYSPPQPERKKKEFSDEALSGAKGVSRLVEKFECGDLDATIESEMAASYHTPEESECEEVESRQAPRRQFSFADSAEFDTVMETDKRTRSSTPIDEKCGDLVETPILRNVARRFSGDAFNHCRASGRNLFPENENGIVFEYAELSPIKKEPAVTTPKRSALKKSNDQSGRKLKTIEEARRDMESCSRISTSPTSSSSSGNDSGKKTDSSYSNNLARAQVHSKIEKFHTWKPETLHAVAEPLSKIRIAALTAIQHTDPRVGILLKLYKVCTEEMNRGMDSMCAALALLMTNPSEEALSVHEEYIAAKYYKHQEKSSSRHQ